MRRLSLGLAPFEREAIFPCTAWGSVCLTHALRRAFRPLDTAEVASRYNVAVVNMIALRYYWQRIKKMQQSENPLHASVNACTTTNFDFLMQ